MKTIEQASKDHAHIGQYGVCSEIAETLPNISGVFVSFVIK